LRLLWHFSFIFSYIQVYKIGEVRARINRAARDNRSAQAFASDTQSEM